MKARKVSVVAVADEYALVCTMESSVRGTGFLVNVCVNRDAEWMQVLHTWPFTHHHFKGIAL